MSDLGLEFCGVSDLGLTFCGLSDLGLEFSGVSDLGLVFCSMSDIGLYFHKVVRSWRTATTLSYYGLHLRTWSDYVLVF